MLLVKRLEKWGIYENSSKEVLEYGFKYTVIHPVNIGCTGLVPSDSDWECDTLEDAIDWIKNY